MAEASRGPLPGWFDPVARFGASVYASVVARRNRAWDDGRGVVTIDRPVISVGNLSVGGTGKTPMVAMILDWLLNDSRRPAIAMRGYKSKGGLSDEAAEYSSRFGDRVPVVAQPDRLEGLLRLFADVGDGVDCVVLDDGFQHRRIARQLDIVLIDASRDPFSDACLPAGWLREPVESLARADAVVVTHAEMVSPGVVEGLRRSIDRVSPARLAVSAHRWENLAFVHGSGDDESVEWLRGKRVFAACAIGNPAGFLRAARGAVGGELAGEMVLRDHHAFDDATVRRLIASASGCDAILVTGKDWAKLSKVPEDRWPCPVVWPRLTMGFTAGETELRSLVREAAAEMIDGDRSSP